MVSDASTPCAKMSYVSGKQELILRGLGRLDVDTGPHVDPSDDLLANEVSDLNLVAVRVLVLIDVDVDGKAGGKLAQCHEKCVDERCKDAWSNAAL